MTNLEALMNELKPGLDAEHFRMQARAYLIQADRLAKQAALMEAALRLIYEQGGDVTEPWSSRIARGALDQIAAEGTDETV